MGFNKTPLLQLKYFFLVKRLLVHTSRGRAHHVMQSIMITISCATQSSLQKRQATRDFSVCVVLYMYMYAFRIVYIVYVYAKYIDNSVTPGRSYRSLEKYEKKMKRGRMKAIRGERFRGIHSNQNTMTLISIPSSILSVFLKHYIYFIVT